MHSVHACLFYVCEPEKEPGIGMSYPTSKGSLSIAISEKTNFDVVDR